MMSSPTTTGSSYWCYRCTRFVRLRSSEAIACPDCGGGFLEEAEAPPTPFPAPSSEPRQRRRFPARVMWVETPTSRRNRRGTGGGGDRSPFNPVIVLRNPSDAGGGGGMGLGAEAAAAAAAAAEDAAVHGRRPSSFELYYDDGAGSGLRPLPPGVSDFLMGSGFDRLLEQLAQIEINGVGARGCEHPPASKAAVESMPTVEIAEGHIRAEEHCAVCKEPFELGADAREMPCKHIYHEDCILPWLSMRNSCPVCRHEMPTDAGTTGDVDDQAAPAAAAPGVAGGVEEPVGLTIWRLPGGGFAVGRFSGRRRAGERELPVVYTEVDGGFNNGGTPRRISWSSRGTRNSREGGGIARAFRGFMSLFGRRRSTSSSSSSTMSSPSASPSVEQRASPSSSSTQRSRSSVFRRNSRHRASGDPRSPPLGGSGWALEESEGTGISRW